jgi:CheY-like chemotaxis protein
MSGGGESSIQPPGITRADRHGGVPVSPRSPLLKPGDPNMQPTRTTPSESFRLQSVAFPNMISGIGALSGRGNHGKIDGTLGAAGTGRRMTALRVLVVEDDAIIGELLAEMLEGMGHDVCAVEGTEADAVAAAARWRPDLMIVDVRLGEGSGVSAVDEIHRAGPIPHVFVSADITRLQALRPGAAIIQKPYREADLARVIQRALDAPAVS